MKMSISHDKITDKTLLRARKRNYLHHQIREMGSNGDLNEVGKFLREIKTVLKNRAMKKETEELIMTEMESE